MEPIIQKLVSDSPSTDAPGFYGQYPEITLKRVYDVFEQLQGDATTGLPWMLVWKTKKEFIENYPTLLLHCVLDRLQKLATIDPASLNEKDTKALISEGYTDPVRVFVKNELHKIDKIKEGRFRLICNVSIVDEVITRLLCNTQNKADNDACYRDCGTAAGWNFADDINAGICHASLRGWLSEAATNDMSGWDWTVRDWCFKVDKEVRRRLCGASIGSAFDRILTNLYICLCKKAYVTGDGKIYCNEYPGVQASGSPNTTNSNSRIRNAVSYLIGCRNTKSMGDDNISTHVEGYVEKAKEYGFRVTDYKPVRDGEFEFCSHLFTPEKAIPLNIYKGLGNLLLKGYSNMEFDQFKREYRHSPDLGVCLDIVDRSGYFPSDGRPDPEW